MAGMFVLGDDGELVGLSERAYDSEDLLQELLADLPGPPRWRPDRARRAAPLAARLARDRRSGCGGRRCAVVDRPPVPRPGRRPDARRGEAQHGHAHPARGRRPDARLRGERGRLPPGRAPSGHVRGRCGVNGEAPESVLGRAFGDEVDAEAFWGRVKTNLQAGTGTSRLRLGPDPVGAAPDHRVPQRPDEPDRGLRRRDQAVRGREAADARAAPRGRTADAGRAKSGAAGSVRGEAWTLERFEAALESQCGPAALARARRIRDWTADRGLRLWWGQGKQHGGFVVIYDAPDGTAHQLFEVWTNGYIELFFKYLANKGRFADEALRARPHDSPERHPGDRGPRGGRREAPKRQLRPTPRLTIRSSASLRCSTGRSRRSVAPPDAPMQPGCH